MLRRAGSSTGRPRCPWHVPAQPLRAAGRVKCQASSWPRPALPTSAAAAPKVRSRAPMASSRAIASARQTRLMPQRSAPWRRRSSSSTASERITSSGTCGATSLLRARASAMAWIA
ncbi:hypothetical protein G6F23_014581 [Rhizopus arrhizus]|nr:hypothetical protein G6F23_014581 [Rhizopus arrhizus]